MKNKTKRILIYLLALLLTVEVCIWLELRKQDAVPVSVPASEPAIVPVIEPVQQVDTQRAELREQARVNRGNESRQTLKSIGVYTITAYCPCEKCCGKWARDRPGGIVKGAAGIELTSGVSVASPLPLGTEIIFNDRKYTVQDRTAEWIVDRYGGKIIDIYFADHEEALKFGRQQAEIYVMEAG